MFLEGNSCERERETSRMSQGKPAGHDTHLTSVRQKAEGGRIEQESLRLWRRSDSADPPNG